MERDTEKKMIISKRLDKRNKKGSSEKSEGISSVLCIQNRENISPWRRRVSYNRATKAPRTAWQQVGQERIMVKVIPSQMDT